MKKTFFIIKNCCYWIKLFNKYHDKSPSWIPSSLLYGDLDMDLDERFNVDHFDEIQEPPPVHIIYPRPPFNCANNFRNLNLKILIGIYIIGTIGR